ncbi:MAG: peptidase BlaR1 [Caulobacteraceae bacterium]|nr:peptidase BlaR1 [Caulobacteraceae bacterium]
MTRELLSGLIAANLGGGLGILAVLALRGVVRSRFGAAMAYRLWLAPPIAALAVYVPAPKGFAPSLWVTAGPQDVLLIFAQGGAVSAVPTAAAHSFALKLPELPTLLLALWLAGVVVATGLTLLSHRRGLRRFGRLTATEGRGPLRAARNGLGPALVGVVRPRLVLPADFEARFTEREQALILAHERHHGLSGDPRINALTVLLGCLNWFNPLVHLAAHLLRVDQELACDAAVVAKFPGERRTYAEALLKSQQACIPMPLGCTWPGRSPKLLQERLTMLAHKNPGRARLVVGGALVGALCLGAGAVAWAAAAATTPPARLAAPMPSAPAIATSPVAQSATSRAPVASTATGAVSTPVTAVAPSIIGMGCFGNICGGSAGGPRDAAAVDAALKAGDARAVALAGGSAKEVLAALGSANPRPDQNGRTLSERAHADSARFVVGPGGNLGVYYDVDGGGQIMIPAELVGVAAPTAAHAGDELFADLVNGQLTFSADPGTAGRAAPAGGSASLTIRDTRPQSGE